jgi:hypothetical protein
MTCKDLCNRKECHDMIALLAGDKPIVGPVKVQAAVLLQHMQTPSLHSGSLTSCIPT